ncbi:MAG TPA: Rrf2 family transcriptional regulator [Fimbriiglobus sp.]|jgi:Rrf2 family protein
MVLLSRKADYALLILSYLNQRKTGGNAREVAAQFGLSRPFVANILKDLCHAGYVTSHRGVKGGYALSKPPGEITLAELLETMEDGFQLTMCTSPETDAEPCMLVGNCPIQSPMGEIYRRIMDVLRGVTLDEVLSPGALKHMGSAPLPMIVEAASTCCGSAAEPVAALA